MRRNRVFWGFLLVFIGFLLILETTGVLKVDVWNLFFPVVVIFLGGWMIFRTFNRKAGEVTQDLELPSHDIQNVDMEIKHGAGRFTLTADAATNHLVKGTFGGGVRHQLDAHQSSASLLLEPSADWVDLVPFGAGSNGLVWDLKLNPAIVYSLRLKTGAGESLVDLRKLQVKVIRLDTGASSTRILLPESAGYSTLSVHAGMASVEIEVPQPVAAQIKIQSGLAGIKVDNNRFIAQGDQLYISEGFDVAENKVRIEIEGGLGSFEIR